MTQRRSAPSRESHAHDECRSRTGSRVGRYKDALETFRKAKDALAHVTGPDAQHKELRRSRILLALGRQALAETEGWLRARRERPLEPVVGA